MVILGMFTFVVIYVLIVLQSYRTATTSWVKFHSALPFGGSLAVQHSS